MDPGATTSPEQAKLSAQEVIEWCRVADEKAAQRKAISKALDEEPKSVEWQAQYDFWHKIITSEVERLRFNGGYEPVDLDLYPNRLKKDKGDPEPDFTGKTQIGPQKFHATARFAFDKDGKKILRVSIFTEPKK